MTKTKWAAVCAVVAIIFIATFAYCSGDEGSLKSDKLMAKSVFTKTTAYGTMSVFPRDPDKPMRPHASNYPEDYPENDAIEADDLFGNGNPVKGNADASGVNEDVYRVVVHRLPVNEKLGTIQVKERPVSLERTEHNVIAKPTMPVILPEPVRLPEQVRLRAVKCPPPANANINYELLDMKSVEYNVVHKTQKGAGFSVVGGRRPRASAIIPEDQSE